jgi:tetratricopeptide (TPR) repeat protein
MYECYWRGLWDEAQRLADEIVSQVDSGSPSSSEHDARLVRARIRLGRGQEPMALGDSTRALELGRHAGYPEMLVPSLALQARVLEAAGRRAEASQLADELLGIWPDRCPTSYWVSDLAFTLRQVVRPDALAAAARSAPAASRWLDAGLALAAGDAAGAAEKYLEIGCLPDQATARMFAARAALAAGGRAAAEAQLRQALVTFRQLAATRYLEEAEALMAIPA